MTYTWGGNSASPNAYRVRPVGDLSDAGLVPGGVVPEFESQNPRPTAPEEVGGSLKVASFNVLNYFLTLDTGGTPCGPVGFEQECRGAETEQELERQRVKLLAALAALDADVVGLMELENSPGVDPAADLAAGLNDLLDTDVWASIDTGVLGTDTIRVGAIYRTDKVTPAGAFTVLDSSVDPRFDDNHHRPTLGQSFTETATGADLTLVMNHLKSKGSCPAASDPNGDQGDGASCWNVARTDAAHAILDWIDAGQAGNGDPDVVLMGDLNSYAMEDPIAVFTDAGYADLSQGEYSYVFDGQWGYLDYALVSPAMLSQVTGVTEFHINSDEVPALDYNTNFKSAGQIDSLFAPDMYRTSDHDPILLGIDLEPAEVPVCEVSYTVHGTWPGGFISQVWIKNIGDEPINGWTLDWTFANGEQVTQLWNGSVSQAGADVSVTNLHYNAKIKAGKEITFGFLGSQAGAVSEPTEFALNGKACVVD
jgi:predicted extracellular nuclease